MQIVRKATAAPAEDDALDYVMSDATADRYGDVIEPDGWQLRHFKRNPIALFGHDSASFRSATGATCASRTARCAGTWSSWRPFPTGCGRSMPP